MITKEQLSGVSGRQGQAGRGAPGESVALDSGPAWPASSCEVPADAGSRWAQAQAARGEFLSGWGYVRTEWAGVQGRALVQAQGHLPL